MAQRTTRRSDRTRGFNPDSQQIDSAVQQFLKSGGTIRRYSAVDEEFEQFVDGGAYKPTGDRRSIHLHS
ncbi:MAG: hypothetical protein RRB13_06095 [bacterium]|nr:hypothetical protein [bacterium]